MVSLDSSGAQLAGGGRPAISADGRYVAFVSTVPTLVPMRHGMLEVFVRDRKTGITEQVSVDSNERTVNDDDSSEPAISADGRFVAFVSRATNLVPGHTNGPGFRDVFLRDRRAGTTERISVDSRGNGVYGSSDQPAISADGRFVAFVSTAPGLVPGDTNGVGDVFVRDRETGVTERVSVDSAGVGAQGPSGRPAISADGRFVSFDSTAPNLVPADTNGVSDVFLRDRRAGTTERVSVDNAGGQANRLSFETSLSADGRFVAFRTSATNLSPTTRTGGIFVRDRARATTERASAAGFYPTISADGRFVAFTSHASNLVPGDTNGVWDIFVYDRQAGTTERANVDSAGAQANGLSERAAISADGGVVAFDSNATNLVATDTNGIGGVFVHARLLDTTSPPPGPLSTELRLSLSLKIGPPTSKTTVGGSGFLPGERVTVRFDGTDVGSAPADAGGSFEDVHVVIPAAALPGKHPLTATGEATGRSARFNFLVRTNWAQWRFSSRRSGFNSFENVLGPSTVSALQRHWESSLDGWGFFASPVLANGVLYALSDLGNLFALDPGTGVVRWTASLGGRPGSTPAVADGTLYVGSADGRLYAVDAASGAVRWTSKTGGATISSPAVAQGTVYLGSADGKLSAFDALTGATRWTATLGGGWISSSPAVANGVVYVGSPAGELYALSAANGAVLWTAPVEGGIVRSSPAVVNGVVYVGSEGGSLYAFKAANGAPRWVAALGWAVRSSPSVANGRVVVGALNDEVGSVYALDARSGATLWKVETEAVYSAPALANGVAYVATDPGALLALDLSTGATLWTGFCGSDVFSSPAVVDGRMYIGTQESLCAFGV